MKFYAKSNGETVEEHTNKVLKAFEKLKNFLNLNEQEKLIIEKIIKFHDLGKINPEFQNRIRQKLKINELFKWNSENIPHEWLSPAFISQNEENEIKEKLRELQLDEERFFNFFIFIILSHHNREGIIPKDNLIKNVINWIKNNWNFKVEYFYRPNMLLNTYNTSEERQRWNLFFPYRVKWLGSLMKCDYCASASIYPEDKYSGCYQKDFHTFLKEKKIQLREFQKLAGQKSDKSIILLASTGIGKTEAAMNWINGQKAFYLLGIKVAVNEMYKRFKSIFGDSVSILHGETSYFFAQINESGDEYEEKIEKARKLSYPLTVSTADQIITSVFKYPGFEFTYLTCSYSKIVLDEIQSFSPSAIAAIVVFLKEIHNLGGKFMLMTATLPPFLYEELKDIRNLYIFEPQLIDIKRHKIEIIDDDIASDKTAKLLQNHQNKKILIICNTIKKAQNLYDNLKEFSPQIIHSHFIDRHRKEKEELIMRAQSPCVWITTQVVEASLDIDFDILLTENASIESLLQRFGRCYRKREYKQEQPNIFIFRSKQNNIYDKDLFNTTWEVLQNYNNKLITEQDKQDMINQVFENVKSTNYYKKYKERKDLLEIGYRSLSKIEAQIDFRDITNNYIVIPENVFKENEALINSLLCFIDDKQNNIIERLKKQAELIEYTMPVQLYDRCVKNLREISDSQFCKRHQIRILSGYEYIPSKGLISKLNKSENAQEPDNIL